jgi:hypothetical protein
LAWRGVGGGHARAGVQMSIVTLQVARAMPAWSVNWCACSNVEAPSSNTLSWDACSMTHVERHSPMHLE